MRGMLILLTMAVLALALPAGAQVLPDAAENAWLRTWISSTCCVTNNCCYRVHARELQSLPADQWRVVATGQVLKRTDWSRDGEYWRCACDLIEGAWTVHPQAFTRCIFLPLQAY